MNVQHTFILTLDVYLSYLYFWFYIRLSIVMLDFRAYNQ
jgi:hypothetical protein